MIQFLLLRLSMILLMAASANAHSPDRDCERPLQQFPLFRLLTQALDDGKLTPDQVQQMASSENPVNPLRSQTKTPDNLALSLGIDRQLRSLDAAAWATVKEALRTELVARRPHLAQQVAAREGTRGVLQLKPLMKRPIFNAINKPHWHTQNGETYLTIPVSGKTEVLHFPDQKLHVRYIDNPFLSSPLIAEDGSPLFTFYSQRKARLMNGVSGEEVPGPRKTSTWPVKASDQGLFEVSIKTNFWSKELYFETRPMNGKWFRPVLRQPLPPEFKTASIKSVHNTPTESWIEITGTYKSFTYQSFWLYDGFLFKQTKFLIWGEPFNPSMIFDGHVYLALVSHGQVNSQDVYVFGPNGMKALQTSKPIAGLFRDEKGAPVARLFGEGEKHAQRSGEMYFNRLTPSEALPEESVHVGFGGQNPGKPIGMITYRGEPTLVLHSEGALRFVGMKSSQEAARVPVAKNADAVLYVGPDGRVLIVTFPYKANDDQYVYELIERPVEN